MIFLADGCQVYGQLHNYAYTCFFPSCLNTHALVVPAGLNFIYQLLQGHSDKFIVESTVGFGVFLKEIKLRSKAPKLLSIKFIFLELCYCRNSNILSLTFNTEFY